MNEADAIAETVRKYLDQQSEDTGCYYCERSDDGLTVAFDGEIDCRTLAKEIRAALAKEPA